MTVKINYEENIAQIEKILGQLDKGELSLDNSIELFGKGIKLINSCNDYLNKCEKKIKVLQENEEVEWSEETNE
ncbi:Exodeoxyribonuclease VII small subunit [Desulfonispora thiosulfatigenes DSM 11270]|uniref:Exodeoxyribonuclease 7 small subunit n=1 Tax=Desulfonispora thiosulfatigenes DSM 11270 TaxID=656914 RepID=A0A1W1VPQ7_DESTI|nr:exodeoxyribonuclease VII small subunit [Desulfonispora thiosulfatigenes]SMB94894.1 Exodeoxyribonuclease VII small subunit [Desulfonispora thiosulfatigenes DSM 11270]